MDTKMYVPVMNGLFMKYREKYMDQFKKIGDLNPVLCIERTFDQERNKRNFEILKDNIEYLRSRGYIAFVWAQAFGFGIPLDEKEKSLAGAFQRITSFEGAVLEDAMCPLGNAFMEYYEQLIQGIAKAGAKRIMLDDDLCLSVRPGLGCACDGHLSILSERMGKPVTREQLKQELFKGEGNTLRCEWLKVMGDTLIDFCKRVRAFADEIDPDIEIGFCAGYTSWDLEGVDALTLTKVLAGKNKPFLRLTGAPYWAELKRFEGQGMAQIIEFTRMQSTWAKGSGVEVFTENDSYPRPRYKVPAAVMETFDFMMAADSEIGQLKYLFEYYSSPDYEKGYVINHLKNRQNRTIVQKRMGHMPSKGVYVHELMRKAERMAFPEKQPGAGEIMLSAFSHAADFLASCGIPTVYEEHGGAAIAFGDSGRTIVPDRHRGIIVDYSAAEALMKRGYDVGIRSAAETTIPFTERFLDENDQVLLDGCVRSNRDMDTCAFYDCRIDKKAKIESVFPCGDREITASYRYENEEGQKFLVFLFRGESVKSNGGLSSSYYRAKQIQSAVEWMDRKMIVRVTGHPGLYMIVKEEREAVAFAFSNFSLDPAYDVLFETEVQNENIEWIGCDGRKVENGIIIDCIQPWSTGAVILKE